MKKIFNYILLVAVTATFSSCVTGDSYDDPNVGIKTYELTTNKTVAEIKAATTTVPTPFAADDIIEAYVTSNDETGNFYNSISFQTLSSDGTAPVGFSVAVSLRAYQQGFTPGRKVYIKLGGLYRAIVDGSMKIGAMYQQSPTAAVEVGRISESAWQNFLFPSATVIDEDLLVRELSIVDAYKDPNLNTLIEIKDVRFVDASVGRTYFDVDSGGGATNHFITALTGGTSQIIRFSSFAPFSRNNVPSGGGNIRGVLTKFGSTYQFMVRNESDIKLAGSRSFVHSGAFTENFNNFVLNQNNFPNYLNDPVLGSKVWVIKNASGNFYLEMTSFNSDETNRTLFFVPVDFTAASSVKFDYKVSFPSTGHIPLKVFYTTNYVPGEDIANATLTNITSVFTGLGSQTSQNFTSSGVYTFPATLTGNGFMIFEYSGSSANPTYTTNFGIDNIVVE